MSQLIYRCIYGLLYPAVLGTVLVNLLPRAQGWIGDISALSATSAWIVVLCAYFVLQFSEAVLSSEAEQNSWIKTGQDLLELAVMSLAFLQLGAFTGSEDPQRDGWWLAGVFVIPPLGRNLRLLILRMQKQDREARFIDLAKDNGLLTILSAFAAVVGLVGYARADGAYIVAVLLVIYVLAVVRPRAEKNQASTL